MTADLGAELAERVRAACASVAPLYITGGGSKSRLGRAVQGESFPVGGHHGVVDYMPTELVITARAGTPLAELEAVLAENGQMLPFEPPCLGATATLGGTIACGLSGPRRPFAGAARDFVLGARIINGRGEVLKFGGQVMKNVAGYDLSRLMAGAQGTLGVLLEVSLKVLPRPECERTVALDMDAAVAIETMNRLVGQALPLSAAANDGEKLWLRLSGNAAAVRAAMAKAGGDAVEGSQFWLDLKERRLPFFSRAQSVWRLSLPPATPPLPLPGQWLLDWGGAQRWLRTDASEDSVQSAARRVGGHAAYHGERELRLPPLPPALSALHRRLKAAFDPNNILNPGRQYPGI